MAHPRAYDYFVLSGTDPRRAGASMKIIALETTWRSADTIRHHCQRLYPERYYDVVSYPAGTRDVSPG